MVTAKVIWDEAVAQGVRYHGDDKSSEVNPSFTLSVFATKLRCSGLGLLSIALSFHLLVS